MKTIAIVSRKGGAGKTTLTLHLAAAAVSKKKRVAVIDLDPQASATGWGDSRDSDTPAVISAQAARLPQVLQTASENEVNFVFIDTSPHSETAALAAIRAADLILIPCRPAILDLRAIGDTVDLVKLAKKTATIIFNAVPPRGNIAQEAAEAISSYGVDCCPHHLKQRAAFVNSLTAGMTAIDYEPKGKAAEETNKLYRWMCKQF
jgi:chromosome partitioning protein